MFQTPSDGGVTNNGTVHTSSDPLDVVLQCAIRPSCQSSGPTGKKSDYIPSVFTPSPGKRKDQLTDNLSTNQVAKKRKLLEYLSEAVGSRAPAAGRSVTENCRPLCDNDGCKKHIHSIKLEIEALRAENQLMRGSFSRTTLNQSALRNSDAHVLTLTGLPTFSILMALFNVISPHLRLTSSLTSFQHFLLTLMKLRLDLSFDFLAFHFEVDAHTVSRLFKHCISVMFSRLVPTLIVWPERRILRKTLPNAFCSKELQNTVCIMDCFEISVEKPCVLLSEEHDYSMVKSYHSFKYLVAMSPQGSVNFISKGWGGHTVDKLITKDSHFLSHLNPGDLVLAGRDFSVTQPDEPSHSNVTIKAFTRGRTRLVPVKLKSSQSLASLRTHVETVAGAVRQKFTLLRSTAPVSFTDTGKENNVMYLDQIVKVCCALTNVCASAVPPQ